MVKVKSGSRVGRQLVCNAKHAIGTTCLGGRKDVPKKYLKYFKNKIAAHIGHGERITPVTKKQHDNDRFPRRADKMIITYPTRSGGI